MALEEMGIRPNIIGGVSAGSVVAVMYAAGMSPEAIIKAFSDIKFGDFAELAVPRDGFSPWTASVNFYASRYPTTIFPNCRFQR